MLMVFFRFRGGVPKAWAIGPKESREIIEQHAFQELYNYLGRKDGRGRPSDYTLCTIEFESTREIV